MVHAEAVLLTAPGVLETGEIEFAGPGDGEIEVSIRAAGVCHTDLHIRDSEDGWGRSFPMLLGHEGSGVVTKVGSRVRHVDVGDHVAIACRVPCGTCELCARGDARRCRSSGASPAQVHRVGTGEKVNPALGIGLFANTVVVDAMAAVRLGAEMPLDLAGVFGCALMTGVGAVINTAEVFPGASVAVIGCGGIGLSAIQGAVLAGAGQIIAVDVVEEKLSLARALGATDAVNGRELDPVDEVMNLSGGMGVDFSFEAVGSARCVQQCIEMLAYAGVATVIGVPPPDTSISVTMSGPSGFFGNTSSLLVSHGGDSIPQHDLVVFERLVAQGRIDLESMIGARIGLTELETGFEMMRDGSALRTIVVFDDQGGGP